MANYDYRVGKKRVESILDNTLDVIEQDELPAVSELTFNNAYKCWVTSIFVDIRDSTKLFTDYDRTSVSKIIRSFTSEIIEILRGDDYLREIGIRGDCVYAIYTTANQKVLLECVEKAALVNTYLKMLNKLLDDRGYPTVVAGIGIGTQKDLIVKAGRKGVGINNPVWIGAAVTGAAKLSSIANKVINKPIALSDLTYFNTIDIIKETVDEENVGDWFSKHTDSIIGTYYGADLIISDFDNWIQSGMND